MKISLAHLPQAKQEKLAAMTAALREAAPAEITFLFGSHARGTWVEDPETGYTSDFDLLVVVETPVLADKDELWNEVERRLRPIAEPTPVTLIVHDRRTATRRSPHHFSLSSSKQSTCTPPGVVAS